MRNFTCILLLILSTATFARAETTARILSAPKTLLAGCKDGNCISSSDCNCPTGATGPAGRTGPQGPRGTQGNTGEEGPRGPTGQTGPQGLTGATGITGPSGPNNTTVGPRGPSGIAGAIGPTGPAGTPGAAGPQGPTGPTGPAGAVGATGLTSGTGGTGPQGPAGLIGPPGDAGPNGGPTGPTGPTGPQGPVGPIGGPTAGLDTNAYAYITCDLTGSLVTGSPLPFNGSNAGTTNVFLAAPGIVQVANAGTYYVQWNAWYTPTAGPSGRSVGLYINGIGPVSGALTDVYAATERGNSSSDVTVIVGQAIVNLAANQQFQVLVAPYGSNLLLRNNWVVTLTPSYKGTSASLTIMKLD